MTDALTLSMDGPVARLTMNRPKLRNAFSTDMWKAVPDMLAQAVEAPATRLVVLQSAVNGVFSAGADLQEFQRFTTDELARIHNHAAIGEAARAIAACSMPVIAAVDGACMGGGFILAGACDIRVATTRSRFGFPPAKLGLLYHYQALLHLVALIGVGQTKRLLLTAEQISAEEALRIGLVQEVVEEEALAGRVTHLSQEIAALSPMALSAAKGQIQTIAEGQTHDSAARTSEFLAAHTSADHLEGLTAFLEKRKPEFGRHE